MNPYSQQLDYQSLELKGLIHQHMFRYLLIEIYLKLQMCMNITHNHHLNKHLLYIPLHFQLLFQINILHHLVWHNHFQILKIRDLDIACYFQSLQM